MYHVSMRFYEELNDFLPPERRKTQFELAFVDRRSVKDLIESLGVPHTEVDLIVSNGEPVDFSHMVGDGERISVYPVFESLDIAKVKHLTPPLREIRFVVDSHLGKLARYLRLLGFDTLYDKGFGVAEIIRLSLAERRIILTRNVGLLKNKKITHGIAVRDIDPDKQITEVIKRLDLAECCVPFSRCMECNTFLEPIPKDEILHRLPPKVKERCDSFTICRRCDKVYWRGTHFEHMNAMLKQLKMRVR